MSAAATRNYSSSSSSSYKVISSMVTTLLYRCRTLSSPRPSPSSAVGSLDANKFGNYVNLSQRCNLGIRSLFTGASSSRRSGTRSEEDDDCARNSHFYNKVRVTDAPPLPPVPSPNPRISSWGKWLLGFVLSMLLPMKQKWESLRQLEGKVEMVVEEVEEVVEVVEKAATVVENVSAKVADQFPNNSRIKGAAVTVEHISNVAVADAQLAQNFIHKVEDVKKDLKDLETMVEPLIDNVVNSKAKPHH